MKQTFVSDVLEIPEKIETALPKPHNSVKPPPADSTTEDDEEEEEDEDDWETKFDESGDCLDPKILQELSESVGKCKIELPKMDYTVSFKNQILEPNFNKDTMIIIRFSISSNPCSMRRSSPTS